MMKVYINIKNNSGLHIHRTLNKRKWLMKRESGHSPTHHFSFGERFDETLMKGYSISCQYIRLSNHQFIGFSPPHQLRRESDRGRYRYHPQVGRTDFRSADRQGKADVAGEKKKATNVSRHHRDTAAGFWGTKSHSSLGRFLHAPLALMLKTPQ